MPGQENSRRFACACQCRRSCFSLASLAGMSTLLCLGGLYIVTSAGMIAFNKFIIHEGRFPYALPLVLLQSGFSSLCALLLLLAKPSLFSSLTSPTERIPVDKDLILRGALPIAVLFAVQLVLSNTAYLHSSMAFLQMMKEANLVLVYSFSLLAALETFSFTKAQIIVMILFATAMTIHGELNFSWTGFFIQGTGQLFESSKIVLQAMLLSSAGRKLDVLTYVILVMPLCFLVLGLCFLVLVYAFPNEHIKTPEWSDVIAWWPVLAGNCGVAFVLNLSIALFMKRTSAVGFILAGIVKDAMIVLAGVVAMQEPISTLQLVGFSLQLAFIWLWSVVKDAPEKFESGLLSGFALLSGPAIDSKSLLIAEPLNDSVSRTDYGNVKSQEDSASQC